MSGYIETVYNEKIRPRTDYPEKLVAYLSSRFNIKESAKILDVGCGRGDFLIAFKAHGFHTYGIDRDPSGAKVDSRVEVISCELEKDPFPFEDQTFDVVFSKSVIEHLFIPEHFIAECRRVLKPGGRIIVMTPDWISQMKIFFDDHTHHQPYTATGAKELLDIFGFHETRSEIFYQLPILWRYPALKLVSRVLQMVVPVTMKPRNKFIRWSVELMILATGVR